MNGVIYIYTFIQFYVILSVMGDGSSSSSSTSKGPGTAVCKCSGATDKSCFPNGLIDIKNYAEECSSYVYDGVVIWANGSINDPTWLVVNRTEGYFEKLLASGKDVYLYMMHENQSQWAEAARCVAKDGEASKEMETMAAYLEPYSNLKGVIFMMLQVDDSSAEDPEYSQNLKVYIDVLKCKFSNLSVGVYLYSTPITSNLDTEKINWLDLKVTDCVVDYYVISSDNKYNCSSEYKCVGLTPLDENSEFAKVTAYLKNSGIPKEKYIYEFVGYADSPVELSDDDCSNLYPLICTLPREKTAEYCADTTSTFYEKGKYAAANGGGFLFVYIDFDDAQGCCQCGRTYPAFRDILDGFKGSSMPEPCCLLDRS